MHIDRGCADTIRRHGQVIGLGPGGSVGPGMVAWTTRRGMFAPVSPPRIDFSFSSLLVWS